jgi:FHS family L-fucose permease-like MFS transporter
MLIPVTFFGSYGFGALIYYLYGQYRIDLLNKIGYKNGILLGMLISMIGLSLFYPISYYNSYYISLVPFFFVGIGFTLLQIACNPYITLLGKKVTASSRLNLAQGINSLGTTLAPIIGAYYLLSNSDTKKDLGVPFLILALIFLISLILIKSRTLPEYKNEDTFTKVNLFKYPQVTLGMIAIFMYVGAEVAIGSKLTEYFQLNQIAGLSENEAGTYVGIYWGGAMIGRLTYAFITNKELDINKRILYSALSILVTFIIMLSALYLTVELTIKDIYPILFFIPIQFLLFLIFKNSSAKILAIFSIIVISLLVIAFTFKGLVAMWSIIAIGLFNSIMWSNIFTISIANLKEKTAKASSLLIIMIVGGAIFPLLFGIISDNYNLEIAYLLPIIAYIYICFFGFFGLKLNHKTKH